MNIPKLTAAITVCANLKFFLQCQKYWQEKRMTRGQLDIGIEDNLAYIEGCILKNKHILKTLLS